MKKMWKQVLLVVVLGFVGFAAAAPQILHSLGMHPDYADRQQFQLAGKRALVVATNHGTLNAPGETTGDPTGVFGSELTVPYYEFLDAGMTVDVASPKGGEIPFDPQSFSRMVITKEDKRYLEDPIFKSKAKASLNIANVDTSDYDIVYFAGGWGAAYDLAQSPAVAQKVSEAYYGNAVIGGVCHGVLAFVKAKDRGGKLLINGRKMTGVSDKQVKELGIGITPMHPETELRKAGANYEKSTAFLDILANHVVIDDEKRFVTGQNQNGGYETAQKMMVLLAAKK